MTISDKKRKDTQNIVKLAVKCMFFNAQEEEKVLSDFEEHGKKDPACSIIEFFKEENVLSVQKIDFLLAFKKFLDAQSNDTEFGHLAIENNFVTREAIKDALDFQNDYYSKTEQTKEISGILLKREQITLKNCTAVLLTQDRIEDDFLAQALNNLGSSQVEKDRINKRFGVIALKKELISLEQLNQALAAQQGESLLGQQKRHLHEILEESTELSKEDTFSILIEQKQFEKRRLNLEKALSNYNSSIKLSTKLNLLFQYRISETGLEAYVSKLKDLSEEIKIYEFIAWLKQAGINYGIVDDKTIKGFLINQTTEEEIVIAKGYPPIDGTDETIEFLFDTKFTIPENKTDVKEKEIYLVKKGDALAKIISGGKGKPGKDVYGHILDPPDFKTHTLDIGKGIEKKELVFIADIDGIPSLYNERTLIVSPYPETSQTHIISENIKTNTGETYKSFDLEINGTIEQDAMVICQNLVLTGDVLGSINATGDVEIKGSIGKVETSENEAKQQANVFAGGNIIVKKNILNAKLKTKKLIASNAEVVSSEIVARNEILLQSVSFSETNPCILQIGKSPDLKIFKIDKMIGEKIALLKGLKHQEEIEKQKLEIEILSFGRKYVLSKQEPTCLEEDIMIKIKGQLAKGTMIKGQESEMIVSETMNGVILTEIEDSQSRKTKISIEGYFS